MYETKRNELTSTQQIELIEYAKFLESMDEITIDTYFALDQERIQVETINYL